MFSPLYQRIKDFQLLKSISYNLQTLKQNPWGEISGSLGDLGTLLPIMTALTTAGKIDFNNTLIFTGIFNILSGMWYGVPIAVQPMKAIASVAITTKMDKSEVMGAGMAVGAVVLFLAVTGCLQKLAQVIPVPIVKGIQTGAGISLIISSMPKCEYLSCFPYNWEPLFWAIFATLFVFATSRTRRYPLALVLFITGLVVGFPRQWPSLGFESPSLNVPQPDAIYNGFWVAGAGQLPLTILNSVIAVNQLSLHLLPERNPPSVTALGFSVGVMNLTGCLFGCMPVCHGSGGLAGQYRCGARSGGSTILLGTLKLLVGLFVSHGLSKWLEGFPKHLLGVLIFLAGLELVQVGLTLNTTAPDIVNNVLHVSDETTSLLLPSRGRISEKEAEERWVMMTITAGTLVMFKNDFLGFAAGCAYWGLLRGQEYLLARRSRAPQLV